MRYRRADSPRLRTALALVAALAFTGCAGSQKQPSSFLRAVSTVPIQLPRAARAEFPPERFETVFEGAVRAVRARGYEIVSCDPVYGLVQTSPVEMDAPCGGSTCLAREYTSVKLGYRRARVTVTREVWDPTVREWRAPEDAISLAHMSREERVLLDQAIRWPSGEGASRLDEACGPGACEPSPASCGAASAALRARRAEAMATRGAALDEP